ncbi:hypothetical protein [Marinoscillum sp. MHG1-6]|uniref:hypothetical protein n=1 Tax=Marinoscillum sp. MHG1-6 TaxID=2959627 RepID=UPI0021584E47|nr:hypothetical protein [Marinoscillum sp. MHG1-6]
MDNPKSFTALDLKTRVACLISYAAVFNDVISIKELSERLSEDQVRVMDIIKVLEIEEKVIVRKGFVGLIHLDDKIDLKAGDFQRAQKLIRQKKKRLKRLGKLPFIKFLAISGSLAAGNPVELKGEHLDVDVFVVTRRNCIWLVGIFMAFYTFFNKHKWGAYCFNHIWDESDLKVYNPNIYTATDIYNMVPIYGKGFYQKFLAVNPWVLNFYPSLKKTTGGYVTSKIVINWNKFFYLLFTLGRCFKNLSWHPLSELNFKMNPNRALNWNRRGAEHGGYHVLAMKRFKETCSRAFPDIYSDKLLEVVFSDDLSRLILDKNCDVKSIIPEAYLEDTLENYTKYESA